MPEKIQVNLSAGNVIEGDVVTAFQVGNQNILISLMNDPSVSKPEGLDNLSVSKFQDNVLQTISKEDVATWDNVKNIMRGTITGSSYPEHYVEVSPSYTCAENEYARNIAVTSDQRMILANDYKNKMVAKQSTPAPVEPTPAVVEAAPVVAPESPVVPEVPVAPAVAPVVAETPVIASATETPVVTQNPVVAPVVETPVVAQDPVVAPVAEAPVVPESPVVAPVTESPAVVGAPVGVNLESLKADFMNKMSAAFDEAIQNLSGNMVALEAEAARKVEEANEMLRAAEEAKKNAEAKEQVANIAFNNAANVAGQVTPNAQMPAGVEIQFPTPVVEESPVLTKTNPMA